MAEGQLLVVKTEPDETIDIESRIFELCQGSSSGITDSFLQSALPNITSAQRVLSLNNLISQGKVEILKRKNEILYKLKDPNAANLPFVEGCSTSKISGRKMSNPVRLFFMFDNVLEESCCLIPGCEKKIPGNHSGNLEKHIRRWHKDKLPTLVKQKEEKKLTTPRKRNADVLNGVILSADDLKRACVRLVTVHERPFSLMKDDAFQEIVNPLIKAMPAIDKNCKGADNEEKIVYQIIEKAKNKGIWIRDIRFQSSLSLTQVNKILKSLEGKKLIKSVKPVNASKKKIYMLYDLEPDSTVTGGTWYTDQEFESEFVEVLSLQCLKFLQQAASSSTHSADPFSARKASYRSSKQVSQYINNLGISKVSLKTEDIEAILNSLVYDDKVAVTLSVIGDKKENLYLAKIPLVSCAGLMKLPCGSCTLLNDCKEGGDISPSTCQYMKEWLSSNF